MHGVGQSTICSAAECRVLFSSSLLLPCLLLQESASVVADDPFDPSIAIDFFQISYTLSCDSGQVLLAGRTGLRGRVPHPRHFWPQDQPLSLIAELSVDLVFW